MRAAPLIITALLCCFASPSRAVDASWPGRIDGSWFWQLRQTPNGLQPYVSWHATGSTDIYVGGMESRD
jgi:hypothetical protein